MFLLFSFLRSFHNGSFFLSCFALAFYILLIDDG
jgi:hypothetical protein